MRLEMTLTDTETGIRLQTPVSSQNSPHARHLSFLHVFEMRGSCTPKAGEKFLLPQPMHIDKPAIKSSRLKLIFFILIHPSFPCYIFLQPALWLLWYCI